MFTTCDSGCSLTRPADAAKGARRECEVALSEPVDATEQLAEIHPEPECSMQKAYVLSMNEAEDISTGWKTMASPAGCGLTE